MRVITAETHRPAEMGDSCLMAINVEIAALAGKIYVREHTMTRLDDAHLTQSQTVLATVIPGGTYMTSNVQWWSFKVEHVTLGDVLIDYYNRLLLNFHVINTNRSD